MNAFLRFSLALSLGGCVALAAGLAAASDTYPDAIKADLMAAKSPGCDLCHNGGNGMKGNVNTPFGKAVAALGLVSSDEATLKTVLVELKTANTDSDGDGTSDIDELVKGTDPNFNEITGKPAGGADVQPPEYGCSTAWRSRSNSTTTWLGAVAVVLSLLSARRRRTMPAPKCRSTWEKRR